MRYVLIDRLLELLPDQRAVAEMTFPREEELFRDHFPGFPVVPGALLTEAMSQTAGWLIAASLQFLRWPLLSIVQSAKFRKFVEPGQRLRIESSLESIQTQACLAKAFVSVDDVRVADATLSFQIFELTTLGHGQPAFEDWTRRTFETLGGPSLLERGDR